MGVSTTPVNLSHRRVCVAILILMGAYAGCVAVALSIALGMIGRGLDSTPMQVPEIHLTMCLHGGVAILCGLAGLILRRRSACGPRGPRLLLVISVLFLAVSVDRITGILFPPLSPSESICVPHPTRGWAYRSRTLDKEQDGYVQVNSFGMRGPEFPRRKAAGEFRILFLGDSITFGLVPSIDETLVARSGSLFRDMSPKSSIRCLNAGVTGYATWQEVDYLRNDGLALDPDLIVLNYCLNDVTDLVFLNPGELSRRELQFSFSFDSHWSGLVRAVRTIRGRRKWRAALDSLRWADDDWYERRGGRREIKEILREMPAAAVANAWRQALADLENLETLCRANGLPWVLVVFPVRSQVEQVDPAFHPQDKLEHWAAEHHIPYLDLLPAFLHEVAESGGAARDLYVDETHPNTRGNRLAAAEIVRFLLEHRFVPQL